MRPRKQGRSAPEITLVNLLLGFEWSASVARAPSPAKRRELPTAFSSVDCWFRVFLGNADATAHAKIRIRACVP
jgi:hypothetical protein